MKRQDLSPLDDLLYMAEAIRQAVDEQLPDGLTYTHFKIMRELVKSIEARPAELASRLGLSRAGIAKALQALTSGDRPKVKSKPVGQAVWVSLTPTGRECYAEALHGVTYSSGRVFWLSTREAHRLENLMGKARVSREEALAARIKGRAKVAGPKKPKAKR